MKTIQKSLCKTFAILPTKKSFFLDIETTGLSKYMDFIFCIGIIYYKQDTLTRIQWMISSKEEELQLLLTFMDFIKDFSVSYTYGGIAFERSFLLERLKHHFLSDTFLDTIEWIDLRRSSFFKKFFIKRKITRGQFEKSLGFTRELSTQGKELAKLFQTYQTTPKQSYEDILFKHNQEELESLLLFYCFSEFINKEFTSSNIVSSHIQEDHLIILFHTKGFHTSFGLEVLEGFNISYKKQEETFSLQIKIYKKNLTCFLNDYKNYYYLPTQKEVIHQSLASFIPASMKRQARKDECILKKEGLFISLPFKDFAMRIWFDDEKRIYLLLEDVLPSKHLNLYLDVLKKFLFS